MRTDLVVMGHPLLDHHLGFEPVAEPIDRQAFIAELSVEALGRPVCIDPEISCSGVNVGRTDL
jgi:hypothetical protein